MNTLSRFAISVLLMSSICVTAGSARAPRELHEPKMMSATLTPVAPGTTLNVTVVLDGAVSADQPVAISTTTPSKFSAIPSTVVVPAGHSSKVFQVTISPNASSGGAPVTGTCNGGSATAYISVQ